MPKIVNISFPRDGTKLSFTLPDETIEYLQSTVDQGEYRSLSDALSALTLEAINLKNKFRIAMDHPVDYPFPSTKCPICKNADLEETHPITQQVGFMKHCPVCSYSFKLCSQCSTGNLYRVNKEMLDQIKVIEYCTHCEFEKDVMVSENFKYLEFELDT